MTDTTNHLGPTLQDFLDGRLDPARQAEVGAHLEGCPPCRRQLEALRWVRDVALRQLPGEDVPPALAGAVAVAAAVGVAAGAVVFAAALVAGGSVATARLLAGGSVAAVGALVAGLCAAAPPHARRHAYAQVC